MSLKDWNKTKINTGWIFEGKTDYNKGRKYQETSLYIYNKGHFRGREEHVVVKINNKKDHSKDEFHNFESEKDAIRFARKYMRKN